MIELELLGLGADSESLVFTDPNGERYTTPITDELRGALRRERPQLDVVPEPTHQLKPSHIQTLLRAGLTPVEIAADHEVDLDLVERFEPPIQAEKEYILQRAQDFRVGGQPDGPRLGDVAVDRLATRGVSPTSILWAARRDIDSPWEVTLSFVQGAAEYSARWHFDPATRSLDAIDQEARWLSETSSSTPLHSIFPNLSLNDRNEDSPTPSADDLRQREALVDQLNAARGKRVDIDLELDDDEDNVEAIMASLDAESAAEPAPASSISARIYSLAQAKTKQEPTTPSTAQAPVASEKAPSEEPGEDHLSDTLPGLDIPTSPQADASGQSSAKDSKRTKRRSVPSWDEIVFGAKPQ